MKNGSNYDDPVLEEKWCSERRKQVEEYLSIRIGDKTSWAELGPLLKSRAKTLTKWVEDDSLWDGAV